MSIINVPCYRLCVYPLLVWWLFLVPVSWCCALCYLYCPLFDWLIHLSIFCHYLYICIVPLFLQPLLSTCSIWPLPVVLIHYFITRVCLSDFRLCLLANIVLVSHLACICCHCLWLLSFQLTSFYPMLLFLLKWFVQWATKLFQCLLTSHSRCCISTNTHQNHMIQVSQESHASHLSVDVHMR